MRITGRLFAGNGKPLEGLSIHGAVMPAVHPHFAPVQTTDGGLFVLEDEERLAPVDKRSIVELTVRDGERILEVLHPVVTWTKLGEAEVELVLGAPLDGSWFYLFGQVYDASVDGGLPWVNVRAVDRTGMRGYTYFSTCEGG
jgi:hypothetical protein